MARQIAERAGRAARWPRWPAGTRRKTLDQLFEQLEKGETQELHLILKGDGSGSVEALEDALSKIDVGDEVSLRVIDRGVGAITETNVTLAAASNAVIIGFNVRPAGQGDARWRSREGVDIRYYSVIYAGDRRDRGSAQGHAQADLRRGPARTAEIREIFRSSQGRQHRRLHGHRRHDPAQRQGAAAPRRVVVADNRPSPRCAGRRTTHRGRARGTSAASCLNYSRHPDSDIVETYEMREGCGHSAVMARACGLD